VPKKADWRKPPLGLELTCLKSVNPPNDSNNVFCVPSFYWPNNRHPYWTTHENELKKCFDVKLLAWRDKQGDQIGLIFTHWAIVWVVFYYRSSPNLGLLFSTEKSWALSLTEIMGWATFWAIFFPKLIRSPCLQRMTKRTKAQVEKFESEHWQVRHSGEW
jgi:hypothetical protein